MRDHFTSSNGTSVRWITLVATDPKSRLDTEPRPRVPMKIWSQPLLLGVAGDDLRLVAYADVMMILDLGGIQ